jgi:hypothetical protein
MDPIALRHASQQGGAAWRHMNAMMMSANLNLSKDSS